MPEHESVCAPPSFKASDDLCESIARLTKRLRTTYVCGTKRNCIPDCICLVVIDICPGIRPIGVGETEDSLVARSPSNSPVATS